MKGMCYHKVGREIIPEVIKRVYSHPWMTHDELFSMIYSNPLPMFPIPEYGLTKRPLSICQRQELLVQREKI